MKQIKASEVREGMEIRWEEDGAVITLPVFEVMTADCGRVSFVPESRTPWHVKRDQVVTVLREPQPDEPTAFGAAVEAGGVWFVRVDVVDVRAFEDSDFQPWQSESLIQCTWAEVCEQGPVTIINADPFSPPAQDATEPRTWDRWEDVPDMVAVRSGLIADAFRRSGDHVERLFRVGWAGSTLTAAILNAAAPFTEVPDA